MKKIVFLSILFLLLTTSVSAQLGLRVYNFQPAGDEGVIFKPTITAEIGYIQAFESRFRKTASFTLINLKTTIPKIPSTGYIESGGQVTITPGYQSYDKFIMFQIRFGYDYSVIKKLRWDLFVGANAIGGITLVEYTSEVDLIESSHNTFSANGIGVQFRMIKDTITVIQTIKGGPSIKAGIEAGDRILIADNDTLFGKQLNSSYVIKKLKVAKLFVE